MKIEDIQVGEKYRLAETVSEDDPKGRIVKVTYVSPTLPYPITADGRTGLYKPGELEPLFPEPDPRDVALDEIQAAWADQRSDDTTALRDIREILEGTGR